MISLSFILFELPPFDTLFSRFLSAFELSFFGSTLLHSEQPKLHRTFGRSEYKRVKFEHLLKYFHDTSQIGKIGFK